MWSVQTAYPQPQGAETCNVVVLPSDKLCHLVVENLFILLSHRLEDVGVHEHRSKAATSRDRCLTDGLNFLWVYSALNRHRGKGQQKVTVEHVHVHAGGQAVVGIVETPGRRGWREIRGTTPCEANCPCTTACDAEPGQGAGARQGMAALAGQRRCRTDAAECTAGCPRVTGREGSCEAGAIGTTPVVWMRV